MVSKSSVKTILPEPAPGGNIYIPQDGIKRYIVIYNCFICGNKEFLNIFMVDHQVTSPFDSNAVFDSMWWSHDFFVSQIVSSRKPLTSLLEILTSRKFFFSEFHLLGSLSSVLTSRKFIFSEFPLLGFRSLQQSRNRINFKNFNHHKDWPGMEQNKHGHLQKLKNEIKRNNSEIPWAIFFILSLFLRTFKTFEVFY